jgi:hypothetical protein
MQSPLRNNRRGLFVTGMLFLDVIIKHLGFPCEEKSEICLKQLEKELTL